MDRGVLGAMTEALAHRGPDGEGTWEAPGIGLGHRRLAILDPTPAGRQPMHDASGRFVVTYNGEIYNFRELRESLERAGRSFRTRCDTEVLVEGFAEWGRDIVERIRGIFAFAVWDARDRSLFLARDPLGVKPLFVSEHEGSVRFGSEIKAILADPRVPRDVDPLAADAFFTYSYTPAPRTGFAAVRQLLPGHAARVDAGGLTSWRYWSVPWRDAADPVPLRTAIERFDACLDRVVSAQMVSDVGIGAFLSGGLDSAAVVRSMNRARPGEIRAYCVGIDEAGFDERDAARTTARSLGVELTDRAVQADAIDLLPRVVRHLEEPTADSSALAVWLLCREASSELKVAMSGDGADELLAGYDTYRAGELARRFRLLPRPVRGLARVLARAVPITESKYGLHQRATRFVYAAELGPGRDHAAWRLMLTDELKRTVYARDLLDQTSGADPLGLYAAHTGDVPAGRGRLAGRLHADLAFYLPNDMLVKVDRMSMAHGLEVRVPFLDPELVELCVNLPDEHKLHRGRVRKHVLRESLRGAIPARVLEAPKSGFNLPVEAWMRGALGDLAMDVVRSAPGIDTYLEPRGVESIVREHRARAADHGHALFAILMFGLWLDVAARSWRTAPSARKVRGAVPPPGSGSP